MRSSAKSVLQCSRTHYPTSIFAFPCQPDGSENLPPLEMKTEFHSTTIIPTSTSMQLLIISVLLRVIRQTISYAIYIYITVIDHVFFDGVPVFRVPARLLRLVTFIMQAQSESNDRQFLDFAFHASMTLPLMCKGT